MPIRDLRYKKGQLKPEDMDHLVSEEYVLDLMNKEIARLGDAKTFAAHHNISYTQLVDTRRGAVRPSFAICGALGIELRTAYVVKKRA